MPRLGRHFLAVRQNTVPIATVQKMRRGLNSKSVGKLVVAIQLVAVREFKTVTQIKFIRWAVFQRAQFDG